eukprot:5495896-Amphidinium_carterae.1
MQVPLEAMHRLYLHSVTCGMQAQQSILEMCILGLHQSNRSSRAMPLTFLNLEGTAKLCTPTISSNSSTICCQLSGLIRSQVNPGVFEVSLLHTLRKVLQSA